MDGSISHLVCGNSVITFFLYGGDDLFIREFGLIVFNNHLEFVIAGVDLFDTVKSIFK